MYQIMDLKDMELHGAALIFQREYEESRRSGEVPAMTPEMEADVEAGLRQIRENAYGAALLEDGELAGFLGFLGPIEGFHGDVRGAFSPFGASAFAGKDRARTASLLLQETVDRMVKDGAALRTARRAHEKKSLLFPKAAGHGAEPPRAGGCFDPRRLLEGYGGRIYGGR